jgi:hypothetical protein
VGGEVGGEVQSTSLQLPNISTERKSLAGSMCRWRYGSYRSVLARTVQQPRS